MALTHETRRAILRLLRDGDKCAGTLARELGARPPAVSHHLSILSHHGLVSSRKDGARRIYSIDAASVLGVFQEYANGNPGTKVTS